MRPADRQRIDLFLAHGSTFATTWVCTSRSRHHCWYWYPEGTAGFGVRPFGLQPEGQVHWLYRPANRVHPEIREYMRSQPPVVDRAPAMFASTTKEQYLQQASDIILSLREHGGKTVLSRVIDIVSTRPLSRVVEDYFDRYPETFRYVYQFPETGLWFGASPELLLSYDIHSHRLKTMSLAGTRPLADGPWDRKNLEEHAFVTDYIIDCLRRHGMEPRIMDSAPERFGQIEHLCDRIEARGEVDPVALADELAPTPALCGYPKAVAYDQILAHEQHRRGCYGGWVAWWEGTQFTAYVNLRCARAALLPDGRIRYNIYVGGGLTAESDPWDEWDETEAKAAWLIECMTDGKY